MKCHSFADQHSTYSSYYSSSIYLNIIYFTMRFLPSLTLFKEQTWWIIQIFEFIKDRPLNTEWYLFLTVEFLEKSIACFREDCAK